MPDTIENDELSHALSVCEKHGIMAVMPRRSADEKAAEAVEHLAFDLVTLEDAMRAGARLNEQKRSSLYAIARRIQDAAW